MEIENCFTTEELPPWGYSLGIERSIARRSSTTIRQSIVRRASSMVLRIFWKVECYDGTKEKRQEPHEKHIDWLGDNYERMYQKQEDFNQQYHDWMTDIKTQLEGIWVTTN